MESASMVSEGKLVVHALFRGSLASLPVIWPSEGLENCVFPAQRYKTKSFVLKELTQFVLQFCPFRTLRGPRAGLAQRSVKALFARKPSRNVWVPKAALISSYLHSTFTTFTTVTNRSLPGHAISTRVSTILRPALASAFPKSFSSRQNPIRTFATFFCQPDQYSEWGGGLA
jgi:hypothetical protein